MERDSDADAESDQAVGGVGGNWEAVTRRRGGILYLTRKHKVIKKKEALGGRNQSKRERWRERVKEAGQFLLCFQKFLVESFYGDPATSMSFRQPCSSLDIILDSSTFTFCSFKLFYSNFPGLLLLPPFFLGICRGKLWVPQASRTLESSPDGWLVDSRLGKPPRSSWAPGSINIGSPGHGWYGIYVIYSNSVIHYSLIHIWLIIP